MSGIVLPDNIKLQASGKVTLVGDITASGDNTSISGFTFKGGTVDIGGSTGVSIQNNVFNGGDTSVSLDGARGATISNNSFNEVKGGVLIGWGLDQSTISSNKFVNCYQPIDLLFNNNKSQGRDITIADNYFSGTKRMPLEVGPIDAYTSNLVVKGNWSENMNNVGQQQGYHTDVAYSVVPTNGVNTLIKGNYASGPGTGVGIEMAGSGEVTGNFVKDFWYGVIVYNGGFNVHDNALVNQSIETVLNYGNLSGSIHNNQTSGSGFPMPKKPGTGAAPQPAPEAPAPEAPTPEAPAPEAPGSDAPAGGSGKPVTAVDDDMWKTGVNQEMWQNARYLTWNDKGGDGPLKVTAVAEKSAAGGSLSFASDGTIRFKPKAGWQGKDSVEYTVKDADGSSDTGKFYVQVGKGGSTVPDAGAPAPQPGTGDDAGSGKPVTAVDDHMWKTGVNETMWQNARYLTWNDKGGDGDLKVSAVAAKSAAGGSISFASDGTIRFNPKSGWQGKDAIQYTVKDADGSSDTGTFFVQVGKGGPTMSPVDGGSDGGSGPTPAPSTGGSGNPVIAKDDSWNAKSGEKLWFNSRYLLNNDQGADGGLSVKSIAGKTAKGGTIDWDASTGTTIYRSKAGFTGKDQVEYSVTDRDGSTDTALIHFDVLLA